MHIFMALMYTYFGGMLEYMAWIRGVNAIKFINPSWDKLEEGEMLYPSLYYKYVREFIAANFAL